MLKISYDRYGIYGIDQVDISARSKKNSEEIWDALANKRQEKKISRRDVATRASKELADGIDQNEEDSQEWEGSEEVPERLRHGVAVVGNVVKYKLTAVQRDEFCDGREFGVGLVVGRQIDRGDFKTVAMMNPDVIELCEVTPLVCTDMGEDDGVYVFEKDELGSVVFPKLGNLEIVQIRKFEENWLKWHLQSDDDLRQFSDAIENDYDMMV